MKLKLKSTMNNRATRKSVNSGEENPRAKLKTSDVLFIREKRSAVPCKWSWRRIAKYFDISVRTARDVVSGRTWGNI